jgi:hypothetical protein
VEDAGSTATCTSNAADTHQCLIASGPIQTVHSRLRKQVAGSLPSRPIAKLEIGYCRAAPGLIRSYDKRPKFFLCRGSHCGRVATHLGLSWLWASQAAATFLASSFSTSTEHGAS